MKSLIVANWKMNPQTPQGAKLLFNSVKKGTKNIKNIEIVICPPFIYLLNIKYKISNIKLGAQDCFWEQKGAFTGEISPLMLKSLNCQYVIIGHSERKRYFKETDEMINKKIRSVLGAKLKPIFCIGETKDERKKSKTKNILKSQIKKGLNKISQKEIKNIIIAYEPIWAIGTGKACKTKDLSEIILIIRKIIANLYNNSSAKKIPILYGGSVNSKNAQDYIKESQATGLLIGGASLNYKEFIKIIKNIESS